MSDAKPDSGADNSDGAQEQNYDLFVRTSESIFYSFYRNRGVRLTEDRIGWTYSGKSDSALFSSIRGVRLQTAGNWENPIAVCRITFADRYELMVTSANVSGYPDPERRPPFRDFVHDLHARMAKAGNTSVKYTAGLPADRYPLVVAGAILLGVIFVIVPFFAMLWLKSFAPAMAMLVGVGLAWPLYNMIEKNAPATYDPSHLPEDLLR